MEIARYIFLVLSGALAGWLGYLLARDVVLAVWQAATAPARPKPARPHGENSTGPGYRNCLCWPAASCCSSGSLR
jgi:hypothetical protein